MGNCYKINVANKTEKIRPYIQYRFQKEKTPFLSIYNSYNTKEFYTINNITRVGTMWKYNAFNELEFVLYIDANISSIMNIFLDKEMIANDDIYISTNIGFADKKYTKDDVVKVTKQLIKYLKCIDVVTKI